MTSTSFHDENARRLSRRLPVGLRRPDEAHRANVSDPIYLERMEIVNDLCSWLKRYLWRFTGMSPRNLQAYLDWYVYLFRVNQARDRLDQTARVVRHTLMADATYRSLG